MSMTPNDIPNNLCLSKDFLELAEGAPDLLRGHLFEPGAGSGGPTPKFFGAIDSSMYLQTFSLNHLL